MENLAKKIVAVMHECSYVEKNGKNTFHGYQYATSADVLAKVNVALVKNGIASMVSPTLLDMVDVTTARGNTEKLATVQLTITLVDTDTGESCQMMGIGSGQDSGDKAVMKAETAAIKYAYMLSLAMSTGDDPEGDIHTDINTSAIKTINPTVEIPRRQGEIQIKKTHQGNRCSDCGVGINDKVKTYSIRQYGRPLCMRCQHNEVQTA